MHTSLLLIINLDGCVHARFCNPRPPHHSRVLPVPEFLGACFSIAIVSHFQLFGWSPHRNRSTRSKVPWSKTVSSTPRASRTGYCQPQACPPVAATSTSRTSCLRQHESIMFQHGFCRVHNVTLTDSHTRHTDALP